MIIEFIEIGKKHTQGNEEIVKENILSAEWEAVEKGKSYPFSQGMAIDEAIKQFRIPKVTHVSLYGVFSGLGLYGIRAHYKDEEVDIFFVDDGVSITPIASHRKPINKEDKMSIFHKWGKWEEYQVYHPERQWMKNWVLSASLEYKQRKVCQECGKVKDDHLYSVVL